MQAIYLDYNASTPLAPEVAQIVRRLADQAHGNPSSTHFAGRPAREIVDHARRQVAELLGCTPGEIVFTSGGSEANNLALKGLFHAAAGTPVHIITTQIEHPAILAPCRFLERLGARVTYLPCDSAGLIDPDDLKRAIAPDTRLISIMHANNETGTVQPIAACAEIAREHAVPMHTDAAQSVGKLPTRVGEIGVDLLSLAGHKFYAPKGVGALYVRAGLKLEPLIHGAGHEDGRRAGTESAMLLAALAAAAELASDLSQVGGIRTLRDEFWRQLRSALGNRVVLNGHPEQRLPNTLNISFVGRDGAAILDALDGVAASTGSACHAGRVELSPVLAAMQVPPEIGMGAVRFSLGRPTTREEIDRVVARLVEILDV
jgi:cysteine desulfurase